MLKVLHIFRQLNLESGGPVTYLRSAHAALEAMPQASPIAFELLSVRDGEDAHAGMPSLSHHLGAHRLPALLRLLRQRLRDFHCVHLHGLFGWHGVLALLASLSGRPLVISTHGNLHPAGLAQRALLKRLFSATLLRVLMRRAAAVIATGEAEAGHIRTRFPAARVQIVPPAVTLPVLPVLPRQQRNGSHWLFVGRIHPHKQLHLLIEALGHHALRGQALRLHVAGSGDEAYATHCRERAGQLGVIEQITWHGFLEGPQRDALIAQCDVLVLPSLSENFSFATAEAMAQGVPVVISDQVGLADTVVRYDAGLVFPVGDLEALVACLQRMQDETFRHRCGEAARRCVEAQMSAELMGQRLLAIYQAAAASTVHEGQ